MTRRITVVGSACVDLVVQTALLPRPGETVVGGSFRRSAGGKGANQAVAAARMGAEVAFEGCVGTDPDGELLREALGAEGVCVDGLRNLELPTAVSLVQLDAAGENQISQASGPNAEVRPQGPYEVCLMTLETPALRPQADLFVLNAAPAMEASLEGVDLLVANSIEAQMLSGEREPARAHAALLARGPEQVVITLGALGAHDGMHHPAFPITPIDTVGAGDAFVGAFVAALVLELPDPLRWGQAAGALACIRRGAQSAPTRDSLESFLKERDALP